MSATTLLLRDSAVRRDAFRSLLCAALASLGMLGGCNNFSSRGWNAEGVRLFEQSRYTEAVERFQRAIDSDPHDADGYYNLARTYHHQAIGNGHAADPGRRTADLAQAERYYYLCLDRDPMHRDSYRGLAVLMVEQGRSEEAFRLLQGWADRNTASPEPRIELARLCEEFGDPAAAAEQLADSLKTDPNNPRALAALGRLREQAGDYSRALSNYQQSLAADRFQPDVAQRVAVLQSASGARSLPGTSLASPAAQTVTRSSGPIR